MFLRKVSTMNLCVVLGVFLSIQAALSDTPTAVYSWTRTLTGASVTETGARVDDGPRIFVRSADSNLLKEGYTPARTIIDFSGSDPVAVINMKGACFIIPTAEGLDYTTANATLESNDGTAISGGTEYQLNATRESGALMTYTERDTFFTANPVFLKLCAWVPIYKLTEATGTFPASAEDLDNCEKLVSGWSFESLITVLITNPYCLRYGTHGHYGFYRRGYHYG